MGTRDSLSLTQARRIALAAQGFRDPRPAGRVDRRHLRRGIERVGVLQIDSVNVAVRAHEMPLFSRLGAYPVPTLFRMAYRDRELFEYWGHEASYLPTALQPLVRWRMVRAERGEMWPGLRRFAQGHAGLVESLLARVAAEGPLRASDVEDPGRVRRGVMWDWSDAKKALEWLFWTGRVSVGDRGTNFERRYDLTERVLPTDVLAVPTPSEEDSHRELLALAARSHGVGTVRDLADYFRLPILPARQRLAELAEEGRLHRVDVQGWNEPAYLHADAALPRWVRGAALLSPFDPVVWERSRAERLFGFHYRIEIYVPAAKRRWGYYVFPFLLGDRLVARVDLKADRQAGVLRALGVFAEPGVDLCEVADALAAELTSMAGWLGLTEVAVSERGDLAPALTTALA